MTILNELEYLRYLAMVEMATLTPSMTGTNNRIVIRKRPDDNHKRPYLDIVIDGEDYPFFMDTLEFTDQVKKQPQFNRKDRKHIERFIGENIAGLKSVYFQCKDGFEGITDGEFIVNLVNNVDMSNYGFLDHDVTKYSFLK